MSERRKKRRAASRTIRMVKIALKDLHPAAALKTVRLMGKVYGKGLKK